MVVLEVAVDVAGAGGCSRDVAAGTVDGDVAGAAGFQVHVPVDRRLLQDDVPAAGNPHRGAARRGKSVHEEVAGSADARFEVITGDHANVDGPGPADLAVEVVAGQRTHTETPAAAALGREIPAVDLARDEIAAPGNLQGQGAGSVQDALVEQVSAAADRKLFDVGGGHGDTEDQLGIPAGLELEIQRPVLDRGQHLGRKLLGALHEHLLLVGLDIIHIGGKAGCHRPEMPDLADLGMVDPFLGVLAHPHGAVPADIKDAGNRHQAGGKKIQQLFHRLFHFTDPKDTIFRGLFHGNDDTTVGGEGEGAGVVDLANQVVGAGGVREGDLDLGILGLVDGGIDRLAGEFLEPPFEA